MTKKFHFSIVTYIICKKYFFWHFKNIDYIIFSNYFKNVKVYEIAKLKIKISILNRTFKMLFKCLSKLDVKIEFYFLKLATENFF